MTSNLVSHGPLSGPLTLYNRTTSRAEEHSARIGHCRVASAIVDAVADANIVWSCLQDDAAVQGVFEDVRRIEGGVKGKVFVESSSVSPECSDEVARWVEERGGMFVSMPVMGEPTMAQARLITCIAAGPREAIEQIRPFIVGVVGQAIIELPGEKPGMASLLKIMGNVLIMSTMEAVAEVNVFAEKCGLGTDNMSKLMAAMFPRPPHAIYNERMLSGDYFRAEPMVEVYKARSLTAHVLDLARSSGASVPGYEIAVKHLETVEEHAGRSADITGIYGAIRLNSGLSFKNQEE